MQKSTQSQTYKRSFKKQVAFNDSEILDVQLIEERDSIKIQEFIRASIKERAKTLRMELKD